MALISNMLVGSSSNSKSGLVNSALANAILILQPPENSLQKNWQLLSFNGKILLSSTKLHWCSFCKQLDIFSSLVYIVIQLHQTLWYMYIHVGKTKQKTKQTNKKNKQTKQNKINKNISLLLTLLLSSALKVKILNPQES